MKLSFGVLLEFLHQVSNSKRYSLGDVVLAAFSVFFMQCESFLEHHRQMQSRQGGDNAQTLFELEQIPTMLQMRNVIDKIAAQELFGIFSRVYEALRRAGYLKPFEYLGGLLIALDGTQSFI